MADVDNTLYDAFGQRQVSTIFTQLNQYHVVHGGWEELPDRPNGTQQPLRQIRQRRQVPLGMVATGAVNRFNLLSATKGQFPSTVVSFNLAPGRALAMPSKP